MKISKKLIAIGMALTLITGLTACGGGGSNDVMKDAEKAIENVKSLSYDMDMDMNMTIGDQKMETSTTGKIDCISDPLTMKMDMDMNMGAQGSAKVTMYAEKADDKYIMYMSPDGTNWMKQTLGDAAQIEQYNAQNSMKLYLEGMENFKETATEKVNGSDAVKYEGVISKEAMGDVMAASGAGKQLTQLGMTEDEIDAMYKDLGQLPVAVWIDKESSLPVKYEMDMTQIMQQMMTKMLEAKAQETQGVTFKVDKMFISMTLSNFNKVDKIEIPEAAKNGQETAF